MRIFNFRVEKVFLILILIVIFPVTSLATPNAAQAAEENNSLCTNEDCSDLPQLWGYVLASVGALLAPHFLSETDTETLHESSARIGAGTHDLKELSLEIRSQLWRRRPWVNMTAANVQIYNRQAPSVLMMSWGAGYRFSNDRISFTTSLKLAGEKIETAEAMKPGAMLGFDLYYRASNRLKIVSNTFLFASESNRYRTSLGFTYRIDQDAANPIMLIGYERSEALQQDLRFLEIGIHF